MRQVHGSLHRAIAVLLLTIVSVIGSPACYTFHAYQVGGVDGREAGNQPSTEWKHATRHGFLWGIVRHDLPIENCSLGSGQRLGIEEVKVETNFGYVLISALTLGVWVPLEIHWRCAKPPVPTGLLQ